MMEGKIKENFINAFLVHLLVIQPHKCIQLLNPFSLYNLYKKNHERIIELVILRNIIK